jgi:hypothetical protein
MFFAISSNSSFSAKTNASEATKNTKNRAIVLNLKLCFEYNLESELKYKRLNSLEKFESLLYICDLIN